MQINFAKMHGCGSDFMVIDAVTQKVFLSGAKIKSMADRHYGVGFDQLVLVEPPYDPEMDFHCRMFRPDGAELQASANGACCLAGFVTRCGLINRKTINASALNGKMALTLNEGDGVTVTMASPVFEPAKIPFRAQGRSATYVLPAGGNFILCGVVAVGAPYCVVTVPSAEGADVAGLGAEMENHDRFPEKTNVCFMEIVGRHEIKLRVRELISGETMSCGCGACAAAVTGINGGELDSPVTVHCRGGDMKVTWGGEGAAVSVQSSAVHVYDGIIEI